MNNANKGLLESPRAEEKSVYTSNFPHHQATAAFSRQVFSLGVASYFTRQRSAWCVTDIRTYVHTSLQTSLALDNCCVVQTILGLAGAMREEHEIMSLLAVSRSSPAPVNRDESNTPAHARVLEGTYIGYYYSCVCTYGHAGGERGASYIAVNVYIQRACCLVVLRR